MQCVVKGGVSQCSRRENGEHLLLEAEPQGYKQSLAGRHLPSSIVQYVRGLASREKTAPVKAIVVFRMSDG